MLECSPLRYIGLCLFFIKYRLFIAFQYVINHLRYWIERVRKGHSKVETCPFKNTHSDVFLTKGTGFLTQNNSFLTQDSKLQLMNFKPLITIMYHYGEFAPLNLFPPNVTPSSLCTDSSIVPFLGSCMPTSTSPLKV
jgi:hypothetical protein